MHRRATDRGLQIGRRAVCLELTADEFTEEAGRILRTHAAKGKAVLVLGGLGAAR